MRGDGWGWRARFGILVIHKDPVAESELWAMAPAGVTIHAARFESPRQPGSDFYGHAPERVVSESPDVVRGLDYLGQMLLDAICICFSTASYFGGFGFDERFIKSASRTAHGVPVTSAALATTLAMRASRIHRPFLVMSPWLKPAITDAAERYHRAAGFDVKGQIRFDMGIGWREMRPWEIYDHQGHWVVRPEEVYQQTRRSFPAGADGIVFVGSGFRCIETIEPLEEDLGVPTITPNQASLWHCLQIARVGVSVNGFGRLFSQRLAHESSASVCRASDR